MESKLKEYYTTLNMLEQSMTLVGEKDLNKQIKDSYIKYMKKVIKIDKSNSLEQRKMLERVGVSDEEIDSLFKNETSSLEIINIKKTYKKDETSLNPLIKLKVANTFEIPWLSASLLNSIGSVENERIKTLLNEYGYKIDEETNELIDNEGNCLNEDTLGIKKYEIVKNQLIKLGLKNVVGDISTDYKKSRLATMLLKIKLLKENYKNNNSEIIQNESTYINEIGKGMRQI